MIDYNDILSGIREEIRTTPQHVDFTVERKIREGAIWKVIVSTNDKGRNELDESLEGAKVWWKGTPNGTAEILSVLPEDSQINLRFASVEPPAEKEKLRVYLPQYLEALENCWLDEDWAETCRRWFEQVKQKNLFNPEKTLDHKFYRWLRKGQKQAFSLPAWQISFLYGPPGTGKTTTLGAFLAQYLIQFPKNRILLLSTTNLAVDEALVAVDKCLEEQRNSRDAELIRKNYCKRLGNHFVAGKYSERTHLLPPQDKTLVEKLIRLEADRPNEEKVTEYANWKREVEKIRTEIKQQSAKVLETSRLAAMTTTRAVYTFEIIRESFPADLIVFDESSQVGQAHALVLAPLGKRCIFTGDPEQLAPIVRSKTENAQEWLGKSIFAQQKYFEEAVCFLDEQSRMAEPICQVVSKTFYKGKLKVAGGCGINWQDERDLRTSRVERNHVSLRNIQQGANYSQQYGGWIRYESAKIIDSLVSSFIDSYDIKENEILILTPFRAQRRLVRAFLKKSGTKGIKVSTVHRSQGTECHTIIFDPVDGNNDFLKTEDARRLVNVALSRAKARLIVCLSENDLNNPIFKQVRDVILNIGRIVEVGKKSFINPSNSNSSTAIILSQDFPKNALNKEIAIPSKNGEIFGRITEILNDGADFKILVYKTGEYKQIRTAILQNNVKNLQIKNF